MRYWIATILIGWAGAFSARAAVDFVREVKPIFLDVCFKCHGPDARVRQADLRLDRRESLFGKQLVKPGDAAGSALHERITAKDPDEHMPPPDSGLTLSATQIETIQRWIAEGAHWPEDDRHWSFIPPKRPQVPEVAGRVVNPIDNFILARLAKEGLRAAEPAGKETLLRRVTYDLTGLPPTPEELRAFVADESEGAYAKVVDRLLATDRYAEHMALPWLEAARYADTDGYQNDRLRYMSVWRDWVLMALRDNVPFDRFTLEQMAGDLIPDRDFYTQVATGFNRNHRINSEGGAIPDEWIVEYIADRVETLGTVYLGLTFNCARCHSHKYDPITQKEFYQLYAFFNGIAEAGLGPNNGNSPPFVPVPKSWPQLSEQENRFIEPEPPKVKLQQTSVPRPQSGGRDTVMVLHELEQPRDTYVLTRGLYNQPDQSERLPRETPAVLGRMGDRYPRDRIGLARWLTAPENPLVARVTVNRFWQHFFGRGIVRTSENFGAQGELPSHPDLLDWLATEFIRTGWDMKAFHRLIAMSATYQQASMAPAEVEERDPDNVLLTRGPRKRLTPYQIRDTALFASGLLVEKLGGPSVKPYMPPGLWRSISNRKYDQGSGDDLYRRSLYTYWMRTIPPPTMMTFNAADREMCSVRRELTTTPLQALTMMNNVTFIEAARMVAERVQHEGGQKLGARLNYLFELILSRRPTRAERQRMVSDFRSYRTEFGADRDGAIKLLAIGEKARDVKLPLADTAAWTMLANTLMNLDEAIATN